MKTNRHFTLRSKGVSKGATFLNELADIAVQLLTLERGARTFSNCANQMTWLLKAVSAQHSADKHSAFIIHPFDQRKP